MSNKPSFSYTETGYVNQMNNKYFTFGQEEAPVDIPMPEEVPTIVEAPVVDLENRPLTKENVDVHLDLDDFLNKTSASQRMQLLCTEVDTLLAELDGFDPRLAEEGLGSFIGKTLLGIANVVGHMCHLSTTYLRFGFKDYKRGELSAYVDSNRATMIFYGKSGNLTGRLRDDFKVHKPEGMKGTYAEAIQSITDFYVAIRMAPRSVEMLNYAKELGAVINDKVKLSNHIASGNKMFDMKEINKTYDATSKIFTTKQNTELPYFKDVCVSVDNLLDVVYKVVNFDNELRSVATIHDNMKKLEACIVDISNGNLDNVDKKQVQQIGEIVKLFALTFDKYATICNDVNRLNHNLVLTLRLLKSELF